MTNGFIQFAFSGSSESKGGVFDATKDENSIVFAKSELKNFERVREIINQKRNEPQIAHHPSNIQNDDVYTQLEKLSQLREKGIISNNDFEAKKKQLLGI